MPVVEQWRETRFESASLSLSLAISRLHRRGEGRGVGSRVSCVRPGSMGRMARQKIINKKLSKLVNNANTCEILFHTVGCAALDSASCPSPSRLISRSDDVIHWLRPSSRRGQWEAVHWWNSWRESSRLSVSVIFHCVGSVSEWVSEWVDDGQ